MYLGIDNPSPSIAIEVDIETMQKFIFEKGASVSSSINSHILAIKINPSGNHFLSA